MLVKKAEDKLHMVTIKPKKSVDDYYQQIFKLWQQAKTLKREKIRKFEITLKPSIIHALISQNHTKIMDVLDLAWEIKHGKMQISSKLLKNARMFQKSLRFAESAGLSLRHTWKKNKSLLQTNKGSTLEKNIAAPAASASLSAAPRSTKKPVNISTNANAKFILTATKPAV